MLTILHIPQSSAEQWQPISTFLSNQTDVKKNPGKSWFKDLSQLISTHVGMDAYESLLIETLTKAKKDIDKFINNPYNAPDAYPVAKGLIYSAELFIKNPQIVSLIESLGVAAFRVGNNGMAIGNDCLTVLANLEVVQSVSALSKFRTKVKKPKVQNKIATLLNGIGKKHGKSADDLEELSVDGFDLNQNHELVITLDEWTGIAYFIGEKKNTTEWIKGAKAQKSTPKEITQNHKQTLKEFTDTIKEIKEQIKSQILRLESLYLKDRQWTFSDWQACYLHHPLVGIIAKNLIWQFHWNGHSTPLFYTERGYIDSQQNLVNEIPAQATVTLWHPVGFSIEEIKNWRSYMSEKQIIQDFKQAFREVYILTDAELKTQSYSNRYAAHILKVAPYLDKARKKGWRGSAMALGEFTLKIPHYKIKAEYWINHVKTEQDDEIFGSGLGATDQVRFYTDKAQTDLASVPQIVFSEVMRDIDEFISTASITNNPYWQDSGTSPNYYYWHKYSFGELRMSGRIRSEVLRGIIPKIMSSDIYSFEENFLCIQGKIRKYKIHMGSGNILMEPNDQYLCIVRDLAVIPKQAFADKIFLPFEGDETLSLIISKALLLAKDNEIEDPTIVKQIAA